MAWNDLAANQFVDYTSAETSPFTKIRPLPVGSTQFMSKYYCIYYLDIQQPAEFQALESGQWVEKRLLIAPAAVLPTVTTTAVSSITAISAVSGGNVTSDGGATVTERGICWATHNLPDITDFKMANGSGLGSYVGNLTNLTQLTNYYVRAYATNSAGTAYGAAQYFTTTNLCTMPLGTYYAGGRIVYYLKSGDPGYDINVCKGLIMGDDIGTAPWGCRGTILGANLQAITYGQFNTNIILAGCPSTGIAARLCDQSNLNGYSDWYLPTTHELEKIVPWLTAYEYQNYAYWSSTEEYPPLAGAAAFACMQGITAVNIPFYGYATKDQIYHVRPFRSF